MKRAVTIKAFYLAQEGRLVSIPSEGIQRVVRKMIKAQTPKKKKTAQ